MILNPTLKKLDEHEKIVIREEAKIEETERRIEEEEKEILASERRIFSYLKDHPFLSFFIDPGFTRKEFGIFRMVMVNKVARHKLIFALLLTFAIVLIWRGYWEFIDSVPILSYSIVSIALGIFLIWLLRKIGSLH